MELVKLSGSVGGTEMWSHSSDGVEKNVLNVNVCHKYFVSRYRTSQALIRIEDPQHELKRD